ncbi:uncharacterized protein LOC124889716 [Capsicum annuum]|uniref:uncharacterized protein LOC124889716 n=1 Tax=Capsicum annuum TaxID=4072 RepID=UPI001FB11749|nr:uncharacterized protein LOC124889716 [Capsicum annuum]
MHKFYLGWFKGQYSKWLEYSVSKDAAYCLCCYLFKNEHEVRENMADIAFTQNDLRDETRLWRVTNVLNIVGASYKHRNFLRQHQTVKLDELIISGEVHRGRGLNQECGLQWPCNILWGSHCKKLENFIDIFSSILYVLGFAARECPNYLDILTTETLENTIKGFDFDFMLHLMLKVLMLTNHLNSSLQKMDQDIVSALELLNTVKQELQWMRDSGWRSLLNNFFSFCDKSEIEITKMNARYILDKSNRRALDVTYSHYFWVKRFCAVIDLLL